MDGGRQLRLLLWKDYLIRKRKVITLAGIVWASAVMITLHVVRINVDNVDYPTCGFPARALPSAGMLTFLQSFMCTINNECLPLEQYDEIPTYESSKLTKLRRRIGPIVNESTLDVAASVPHALKLLATLADVADNPTILEISKNGLRVRDLFTNPPRVKRLVSNTLHIPNNVSESIMDAELNFQGLLKGSFNRCSKDSVSKTLKINIPDHMTIFVESLCSKTTEDLQKIFLDILFEVDYSKYLTMFGDMYYKLSGDKKVATIGDMMIAVFRMMNVKNFLPPELVSIFYGQRTDFSYMQLSLIPKIMDQFKPTFGDTDSYQLIRSVADTAVIGLQYLDKLFQKLHNENGEYVEFTGSGIKGGIQAVSNVLHHASDVLIEDMRNSSTDVFHILSQVTNFITKFLSPNTRHDVLFYSTLLSKLIESASKVIYINMHLEELVYNVTSRHSDAIKILRAIKPETIGRVLDALADADRAQMLTSKLKTPGSLFCDVKKLKQFLSTSDTLQAESLKKQLCNDIWRNYAADLIKSFGVFEVKDNINRMASLLIQETLGKDTSDQLYTIDQDFNILKNFTQAITRMDKENKPAFDWSKLFNVSSDSELMETIKKKAHVGKQILIVLHGALAKEIVQQNAILDFKISPFLEDVIVLTSGVIKQLELTPDHEAKQFRDLYYDILMTVLKTSLNDEKTYKSLSTSSFEIMCIGVDNAREYLELPSNDTHAWTIVHVLCNATTAIEKGFRANSPIDKALKKIISPSSSSIVLSINWSKLINNLKTLYIKLDNDYPYVFDFSHYGMNKEIREDVNQLFIEAKEFWFGVQNMERSLRLSVKLALRFLDILDYDLFNITNDYWLMVKYAITKAAGPISVFDQSMQLLGGLITNSSYQVDLPPSTVGALEQIIPNLPQLMVDGANIIVRDDTDIQPIISLLNSDPAWPCSNSSLSELLALSPTSKDAIISLETLFCMNNEFQQEWIDYLAAKNITTLKENLEGPAWNKTDYPPHLFLKLSAVFDSLVKDIEITGKVMNYVLEDNISGHLGLKEAWKYTVKAINTSEKYVILRQLYTKCDTVLNAVNTSMVQSNVSSSRLWERFINCSSDGIGEECRYIGRAAWKYFFGTLSVILENVATDLLTYFKEINDPDSNLLQNFGFTSNTGLYILYNKMPDFVGVLLNSFWDYGFMSQVHRASQTQFWDCEAVVSALVPPAGSIIDAAAIKTVQPLVCPTLLHWLSLPRGENVLLDVFAKPQYYFFRVNVENITSRFENAYTKFIELTHFLTEISINNKTFIVDKDIKMKNIEEKLKSIVDKVMTYKIKETDPNYRLFSQINHRKFVSGIYLTRIVAITNKLSEDINKLQINDIFNGTDDQIKSLEADMSLIKYLFKRRPIDALYIHYDIITDVLDINNENYTIVDGFDKLCSNIQLNISRTILISDTKALSQICNKKYKIIYEAVQNNLKEDFDVARESLVNLVKTLQDDEEDSNDIYGLFNKRKLSTLSIKTSIQYSYDLSIPIYLKYLQSNIESYDILVSFLAGEDWWEKLRAVYNGPYAAQFFSHLEKGFEVADELLTNFDALHIVRLLHEINLNETDSFCQPNIRLSDFMPDSTGLFSNIKTQICSEDRTELIKEIPPLLFASQGYESSLKLSKEIDYIDLNAKISKLEAHLEIIRNGPKSPLSPPWVTEEKRQHLQKVASNLLSTPSVTRFAFAVLSNGIDAGTLFLNSSQCTICSRLTTWLKQLNLQLFKKQEYDNLLCHLHSMSLEEVHQTLKNDFHWDMAIRELISTRNYTKYEMNKSMNEFLSHVRLYLLEDITANRTKLTECLAGNISRNAFGNATLFASVLSNTGKLLRAELPHIHEIEGIKDITYLKELSKQVDHNLNVKRSLKSYLTKDNMLHDDLMKIVELDIANDIEGSQINLRKISSTSNALDHITLAEHSWDLICNHYNCSQIGIIMSRNINTTLVDKMLPKHQQEEFWRFNFISNIIEHIEGVVSHAARLLGVASKLDVAALSVARTDAVLDTLMMITNDDILNALLYSLQGIVKELRPVLTGTSLEHDLDALPAGLNVIEEIRNDLLDDVDLRMEVKKLFLNPDNIELELSALGINNTNFWSIAAPRIHAGYIQFEPLLTSKQDNIHISSYACHIEDMWKVLEPSNLDVVTAEDVYAAVVDQFCGLPDETVRQVASVLFRNFNFTIVIDEVKNTLLTKLYTTSNLTEDEGSAVISKYGQMSALMPVVQDNIGYVTELFSSEPMFQALRDFRNVGNLLSSSQFLSSAGNIMCGKPFVVNTNKFYKQIVSTPDMSTEPDRAQLDVLPTEFCRSLYKDIINVEGGKIIWSFVKPLIMGKILYTPPNPVVHRIMEKANETFSSMIKMTSLVHSFAKSFSSVDKLSSHRDGIVVLRNVITNPQFNFIRSMIIGDDDDNSTSMQDFDVNSLFDEFGDIKGIGNLLSKASDLLHCINMDRFQPSPNEDELIREAAALSVVNEFTAGVVFLNSETQRDYFTNVEYKIRMDIENSPTTSRLRDYLWIPGPEANFLENMRYFRGFIQIQDIVDKAVIQLAASINRSSDSSVKELDWAMYTQQTPYPCYSKDYFQTSLYESQSLVVAFFFALLFTVASTIRFIVSDKETGNTMLMSVMGVNLQWHTLSWLIVSLVEMVLTMVCVTIILYAGNILPTTDPSLVLALLLLFGLSTLSFCYMMSKMFQSASLGAVCGAITYLVTFMPYVIILSLEAALNSSLKLVICLSMSSAFSYSLLYLTRYEARGSGAGWAQLWDSPNDIEDMNIGLAGVMMIIDAAIYLLIGWIIDRYFGLKTLKTNITHCSTTNEKAGVSIVNVSKVYHKGSRRSKLALDNVSIELHHGQITTLLGHNGAGKTTLINILTGMLKPSKGHVVVRSEQAAGARVGVCPQRDVLLESLTAAEHLALYSRLNSSLTRLQASREVDRMLKVLSLGSISSEPVSRLSGGTRRRLCVALAFIGRPHLISLDEPTAGVDPCARRDIWSMIMKLKEDRTILMTTHHLDEAELLSDQIVIMHKGQIHTTGSPVEIKRTLGNGYKLTVIYPHRADVDDILEDISQEEKTKQLLKVVRDIVKNANLIDVNGLEVEIGLPFFDANGLNNNFYQMCLALEAAQPVLGFKNFTMDCSSLEEVFFNVCQQADNNTSTIDIASDCSPSKSTSSSSVKTERAPQQLVPMDGPLKGSSWEQFTALMSARYLHHTRNWWLLFLLIGLPTLFVTIAMGFSMLRPPVDNEIPLKLSADLYANTTDFIVPELSIYSKDADPTFAEQVLRDLMMNRHTKNWTTEDSPECKCGMKRQICEVNINVTSLPDMMVLPDVYTLNQWLVDTQEIFIEKRYGGYSGVLHGDAARLVAWYNNKGAHAAPARMAALSSAVLRAATRRPAALTTYAHPLKISREPITKSTVYQHIADAGVSGLVLMSYALVSAGAAIYLVSSRQRQEKRLQLLCGVTPLVYWTAALTWDMIIIFINLGITAIVMSAFGFPVFVARNNLPAICILIILYGFACGSLVHTAEKLFAEASVANMVLFCGNAFLGLSFITILLICDIISESEATDNARYILHKVFLLSPQFALGDGLLEIAKNTIQAQVLSRFGMNTYKDPLDSNLLVLHYSYLVLVGTALLLLNLAIEYNCFEKLLAIFRTESIPPLPPGELEPVEVSEERKRVRASRLEAFNTPLRVNTIGNINRGYVHTEGSKNSMQRVYTPLSDAAQCVQLSKVYRGAGRGARVALRALTLGIPPRQCTALLGQNGAGKSTTFSLLTGEIRPSSGEIYLNNKLVNSTQLCTGLISYCPQRDAIDPLLTVSEMLRFYCRLRGIVDVEQVINRTVAMFDLSKYREVRAAALSGGNRRKLCTAIAFMSRAPLVLLDEPTSGMDPGARVCVSRGVRGASAARGVLLATHALQDARRLAARVALLRAGRLVALSSLDDCLSRFGGGHVVVARTRAPARAALRRLVALAPHAAPRAPLEHSLHALLPARATVDDKEVTTRLSDIFRLMAELQATCDIEDFTVNQSTLEQMFLSFVETDDVSEEIEWEPIPLPVTEEIHQDDVTITTL